MARPTPVTLQQEVGKRRPFDAPEQEAYLNLVRTHAALSRAFARLFKEHGLSDAQYNALRIVVAAGSEGVRTEAIGARMVARDPDTTRLIDRLVRAGLVDRRASSTDRRCVVVVATDAGIDAVRALDAPVLDLHRDQLGHLTRAELGELNRLLVKARRPERPRPAVIDDAASSSGRPSTGPSDHPSPPPHPTGDPP